MSRRVVPSQLWLFNEFTAPEFGAPVATTPEACTEAFVEILTHRSSTGPCLIDQVFDHLELRMGAPDETGDALTTNILGFAPDDLPRFSHNACKGLGDMFEKLLRLVYESAFPDDYTTDYTALEAAIRKAADGSKVGKWKPDFLIKLVAQEIKYRAGNGQGSTEQAQGARTLKMVGYSPRMLLLRPSPNTAYYAKAGWECHEGRAVTDLVRKETGLDIEEIIARAGRHPKVAERRAMGRDRMLARHARGIRYMVETYRQDLERSAPGVLPHLPAEPA